MPPLSYSEGALYEVHTCVWRSGTKAGNKLILKFARILPPTAVTMTHRQFCPCTRSERDRREFRILLTAGGCTGRLLRGIVVRRCGVIHRGLSSIELERTSSPGWCKLHQLQPNEGQFGAISEFSSEAQSTRKPLNKSGLQSLRVSHALDIVSHDEDDVRFRSRRKVQRTRENDTECHKNRARHESSFRFGKRLRWSGPEKADGSVKVPAAP